MEQPYEYPKKITYKGIEVTYKVIDGLYYLPGYPYGFTDRENALKTFAIDLEVKKQREFKKRAGGIKRIDINKDMDKYRKATRELKRDMQEWADK